eukprot:3295131-Ditylum_brightwellii.AAC.1
MVRAPVERGHDISMFPTSCYRPHFSRGTHHGLLLTNGNDVGRLSYKASPGKTVQMQQGAAHDSIAQECVGKSGNEKSKGKYVLANTRLEEHVGTNMAYE